MVLFAAAFLFFYLCTFIVFIIWFLVRKGKLHFKYINEILMASIIYTLVFLFLALATSDPIPYWEYLLLLAGLTSPFWYSQIKRDIAEEVAEEINVEEIEYRDISLPEAKEEILAYGKTRKELLIEDIVTDLKIDPVRVIRAIRELGKEKKLEEIKREK